MRNLRLKKFICLLLTLLIAFSFSSCSGEGLNYFANNNGTQSENIESFSGNTQNLLKIIFLDVGQGDSNIILLPDGKTMLIDAGDKNAYSAIESELKNLNITNLNYVVATHPHADHIGSMAKVINNFSIENFYMPNLPKSSTPTTKTYENMISALEKSDINNIIEAKKGTEIAKTESYSVVFLSPQENSEFKDLNNYSAVVKITFNNTTFMFMGDAEKEIENNLLNSYKNDYLKANVIKLGHHGSSSSSTYNFLKAVNPNAAIISCGADNSYGHPHKETISTLNKLNIKYYQTSESGNIVIESNGQECNFLN